MGLSRTATGASPPRRTLEYQELEWRRGLLGLAGEQGEASRLSSRDGPARIAKAVTCTETSSTGTPTTCCVAGLPSICLIWYEEGLASYLATISVNDDGMVVVGRVPYRFLRGALVTPGITMDEIVGERFRLE